MRAYVSPIGYDSTRITRPVLSHGLDTDDRLVLVRPSLENDEQRAHQAIRDVKQMVTQIEPDIEIERVEIPHDDLTASVGELCEIIDACDRDGEVVVNLSGGPRDLLISLLLATLVHQQGIDAALTYSDIDGEVRQLPVPNLTVDIPEASYQTLRTVADRENPISISELTEARELAKSTVTRHLKQLEDRGLVDTRQEGKVKFAELTFTGKLHVRARS